MYCWKCGTQIADGSAFCAACGAAIKQPISPRRENQEAPASQQSTQAALVSSTASPVRDVDRESQTTTSGMLPPHADAPNLYAGFWRRAVAFALDCLVLVIPYAVLQAIARLHSLVALFEIVLFWLYYALFESSPLRATPGKLALGLAVVDAGGQRISFGRATGRYLCRFLSFITLLIGYLMAGWTRRKQCLHDMLADAYVVRKATLRTQFPPDDLSAYKPPSAWVSIAVGLTCLVIVTALSVLGDLGYRDYLARSQISRAITETAPIRTAIANYVADKHLLPHDEAVLGTGSFDTSDDRFLREVDMRDGVIVATFGSTASTLIRGGAIRMTPAAGAGGAIVWNCAVENIQQEFVPVGCSNQGSDLSFPVAYARPEDPSDIKAWERFLTPIVEQNMGSITHTPYVYFVPSPDDSTRAGMIQKVQDQLSTVVAATVLPGNMVAAGGPNSATTAHVLETAFQNASPGSFKGVVILFIGDESDAAAVRQAVYLSGATFKFAQM